MVSCCYLRTNIATEGLRRRKVSTEHSAKNRADGLIPIPVDIQAIEAPIIQEHVEKSANPAAAFSQRMVSERRNVNQATQGIAGWSNLRILEISEAIACGASVTDRLPAYREDIAAFRKKTLPILEANKKGARQMMRRIGNSSGLLKGQVHSSVEGYCTAVNNTIALLNRMIEEAESLVLRANDCKGEGKVRKAASLYERAAKHILGTENKVTYFSHGDGIDTIPSLEIFAVSENYNSRRWRREIREKIVDYVRETDEVSLGLIGVTFSERTETTEAA